MELGAAVQVVRAHSDHVTANFIREPIDTTTYDILDHSKYTMSVQRQISLAQALPPRLIRFFEKYPPPSLLKASAPAPPSTETSAIAPAVPNASPIETPATSIENSTPAPLYAPAEAQDLPYPNPFLPRKNHTTGRWYGPVYGLRKQADLVKLAQKHSVLDLLPWTIKKPGEKERRRIEKGLQVKGTGEGQKVKGKLWERTLKGRLEMRKKAMLEMPQLIQEWKQVSVPKRGGSSRNTDKFVERSRSWLEEVSFWKGEEIIQHQWAKLEKEEVIACLGYNFCNMYILCVRGGWTSHWIGVAAKSLRALYNIHCFTLVIKYMIITRRDEGKYAIEMSNGASRSY